MPPDRISSLRAKPRQSILARYKESRAALSPSAAAHVADSLNGSSHVKRLETCSPRVHSPSREVVRKPLATDDSAELGESISPEVDVDAAQASSIVTCARVQVSEVILDYTSFKLLKEVPFILAPILSQTAAGP